MATVNNGEFTISRVSMEKVLEGTPCGSAICFSIKTLITQNWLFLVIIFLMFFSSLVFFQGVSRKTHDTSKGVESDSTRKITLKKVKLEILKVICPKGAEVLLQKVA